MKKQRTHQLAAMLCVVLAWSVSARPQEQATQEQPTKEPVAGAVNYVRLDPNFASGGATTADAFATLKKMGFRTVINLRMATEPGVDLPGEEKLVTETGLRYVGLPFSPGAPDVTAVEGFLRVARDAASQPVYVHCASGQRANAFWMIKRVVVDGWTIEKALAEADSLKLTHPQSRDFALNYLKNR
jgi:uncharacterized protein (TIGR01244 family)